MLPRPFWGAAVGMALTLAHACAPPSLENYAAQVQQAARPGPRVRAYLTDLQTPADASPAEVLAAAYYDLLPRWTYAEDPPDEDHFAPAERTLAVENMQGDCEDFAVLMLAICQALELEGRLCLAQRRDSLSGHVWAEVTLSAVADYDNDFAEHIGRLFSADALPYARAGKVYLAFVAPEDFLRYRPTHYVSPEGVLAQVPNAPIELPPFACVTIR